MRQREGIQWKKIFRLRTVAIVVLLSLFPSLFLTVSYWYLNGGSIPQEWKEAMPGSMLFSFTVTVILYFGVSIICTFINQWIPWSRSPVRRVMLEAAVILLYSSAVMILLATMFNSFFWHETGADFRRSMYSSVLLATVLSLTVAALYEGAYLWRNWKNELLKAERVRAESATAQYMALRNQLNPHFLFNTLNALSSLVSTDPVKAEKFIEAFSNLYRYVLEVNEKTVSTVADELQFLESYLFLQQIRFGENLKLQTNVTGEVMNHFLPPLALQLLVENAVEHNRITTSEPLTISISSENGNLVVRNTWQPRSSPKKTNGIGQKNLAQRYALLDAEIPEFKLEESFYTARLPLIAADL